MDPIIIIGTGMAGYTLAREFRKLKDDDIVLISQDDGAFYSKPMLSNALVKQKSPEQLVNSDAIDMMEQNDIRVINNTCVAAINTDGKNIQTDQGEQISYSKLVLAVGATPIASGFERIEDIRIYSVNNLQDYASFRKAIESKERIAIIGPGLIGCEFANDLVQSGYTVDVIGPGDYPLDTLVPKLVGTHLKTALQSIGVKWHLKTRMESIQKQNGKLSVILTNGVSIKTDIVLSAIGLRANTNLAQQAGLEVHRGIVVDKFLQTSTTDIYALGDCAEVDGKVLPFIMPLMASARALAKTLAGESTEVSYPFMPVVVKTPAYPIVSCPPDRGSIGEWQYEKDATGITAIFLNKQNQIKGFCLTEMHVTKKQNLIKEMDKSL